MKRSRVYALEVLLVLVVLVVSGCAAPKVELCPTTVPQSCPTTSVQSCPTSAPQSCPTNTVQSCPTSNPQSCPTTAAQAMPNMNGWRWSIASYTNVVITFDKGDKCSMEVINPLTGPGLNYEIVTNDPTYQNYMVVYMTLDPGKTLADLEAWTVAGSPPFAHSLGLDIASPASRTAHAIWTLPVGQLYFSCLVQGPGALKLIGSVGPVEVPAEAP
jgi:hypothetical protein